MDIRIFVFRTGTFVAIEMAISKLKGKEVASISDLAKSLRDQRMGAIQNDQVRNRFLQ